MTEKDTQEIMRRLRSIDGTIYIIALCIVIITIVLTLKQP